MSAYITSIGTANPTFKLSQDKIADFMCSKLQLDEPLERRLKKLYRSTQIDQRHSVIEDFGRDKENYTFLPESDDFEPFPTVTDRMKLFRQHAPGLAHKAAEECLPADFNKRSINHLITVSSTGFYSPGWDIELIESLGLNHEVHRVSIQYMGCCAIFNALRTAASICKSDPGANVLIVGLELCTIHFQKDKSWKTLIANSLFGDGAAAVLVQGQKNEQVSLELDQFHSLIDPDGKDDVTWEIGDHGFIVNLSAYVPALVEGGVERLLKSLNNINGLNGNKAEHFAIHPGGKRILEACENALDMKKEDNTAAYKVLKNHGNMSSPSILFVLKEKMKELKPENKNEKLLSIAFGPGITLESMLMRVS